MEKLNAKKVRGFLKGLNAVEFRYLELTVQIVGNIQNLIERYKLSKERFCELFEIKPNKYDSYIKGDYDYSVRDMAVLNAVYQQLESERIAEQEIIQVTDNNEK